jgi:predicted Zn finger-like uncharacterized protein
MKTQCPNCKSKFSISEPNIGKQAKCPKCAKPFIIEPFAETPKAVVPDAKIAAGAESPVKSPEPVKIPVKPAAPPPAPIKEEKPQPKAVSKTALPKTVFVYGWAIVRIIAGVLGVLGLMMATRKGTTYSALMKTFAMADVFLVLGILIELALYYRMWAAIQDNPDSISPIKAIGFLFIPVFNIYWMLNMLTGFAEDYNDFIKRHSINTKELPVTLFIIYAFLSVLTAVVVTVPMLCVFLFAGRINSAFVNYTLVARALFFFISAAGTAHFITYILVSIKTCDAVNALTNALAKNR